MTLSSSTTTNNNEKSADRSMSTNSSPQLSPKQSPQVRTKKEQVKLDNYLALNYSRDFSNNRHEGSTSSSQDGSISSRTSYIDTNDTDGSKKFDNSFQRGKDHRSKKKSWFTNTFYPTYKSRRDDFKKVFKSISEDERLVVDYSCALLKDILLHGRLYVTPNYLCFHSNILGYETSVQLKWKEVTSVTKEKTAVVIPNAVQICTKSDKYFFASFLSRDSTYLMLLRIWQHALIDNSLSNQQMWQWIHGCYGNELGLSSDDEDYLTPTMDLKASPPISGEPFFEETTASIEIESTSVVLDDKRTTDQLKFDKSKIGCSKSAVDLTIEPSDSESDTEKPLLEYEGGSHCPSSHDGRLLLNEILPFHVDQLFTLLFTNSKFYLDFHTARKTKDVSQTVWIENVDNSKTRILNLTVTPNQTIGPKTAQVTETQVMLPCSKAGHLYAIDCDIQHAGIPYADNFYIVLHYCLRKISDTESALTVYAQIKYKKSMWGLVKGIVEKSCWSEMDDFFSSLNKALQFEEQSSKEGISTARRKHRLHSLQSQTIQKTQILPHRLKPDSSDSQPVTPATIIIFVMLLLLITINVVLFVKLRTLENNRLFTFDDVLTPSTASTKTYEELFVILQQRDMWQSSDVKNWKHVLNTTVHLLKQAEKFLTELQLSIDNAYNTHTVSQTETNSQSREPSEL